MRTAGESVEERQDKLDDKVYEAQEAAILTEYHLVLQKILSRTQDRARDMAVCPPCICTIALDTEHGGSTSNRPCFEQDMISQPLLLHNGRVMVCCHKMSAMGAAKVDSHRNIPHSRCLWRIKAMMLVII